VNKATGWLKLLQFLFTNCLLQPRIVSSSSSAKIEMTPREIKKAWDFSQALGCNIENLR